MSEGQCDNKIRYSLSDRSGVLRFEAFDIVDDGELGCKQVAERICAMIIGRPLAEVDVSAIEKIPCSGGAECVKSLANVIRECQGMFTR